MDSADRPARRSARTCRPGSRVKNGRPEGLVDDNRCGLCRPGPPSAGAPRGNPIGVDSADQVRRAQGRRAATQSARTCRPTTGEVGTPALSLVDDQRVWTLPTRPAEGMVVGARRSSSSRQPSRRAGEGPALVDNYLAWTLPPTLGRATPTLRRGDRSGATRLTAADTLTDNCRERRGLCRPHPNTLRTGGGLCRLVGDTLGVDSGDRMAERRSERGRGLCRLVGNR